MRIETSATVLALVSVVNLTNALFGHRRANDVTERMYRDEFVRAMREIEEKREHETRQKSIIERIFQIARKLTAPSDSDSEQNSRELNNAQYFKYEDVNDWNIVGNLAGMAIKYTGCQNIKRWSDYMAIYDDNSPLIMDRFVLFRLCEADSCSAYNKRGCDYNFGEYMIPMEDYLSLMAEYHFQQFSRYCKTCYHCMKLDYYQSDEEDVQAATDDTVNGNTTFADYDYGDDYWAGYNRYWGEPDWDDDGNRNLGYSYYKQGGGAASYYYGEKGYNFSYGDDNYNGDRLWYEDEESGKCIFENVCTNFRAACKTFNPNATFYESYFTCSKFTVGNNAVYLAPHCRSDGHSIGIGIYSDQYCSEFIGDEVDISDFTGQNFDDKELQSYYSKTCLSCSAADGYSLITDDALGAADEGLTYPLCTALYQNSAKCNMYAANILQYNDDEVNQEMNEEEVCQFIESMHDQSYNEYGVVLLDGKEFSLGSKRRFFSKASPLQRVGLFFSIGTFLALSIYSVYLSKKLYYRKPWRPPRSVHSPFSSGASVSASANAVSEAGRLSRANSGIMAMRSGEGSSYYRERDGWADHDSMSRSQSQKKGHFA
ncbi:hypothetical protein ACA910_017273 [Epithemia clementina (nom. ined.)]